MSEKHQQGTEPTTGVARLSLTDNDLAIISLGPPGERVVTITRERMASLRKILEQLASSPPKGVVVQGSGEHMFTAGADISLIQEVSDPEIGAALAREGQEVFDLLAKLDCTTVAVISGACVGGGCELALACDYRVISKSSGSLIGLPETKLGIIPGFGGTQRLPRLVGLPQALSIILAGRTLKPKQAYKIGLVDQVVDYEKLNELGLGIASGKIKPKRLGISFVDRLLTSTSIGRSIVEKRAHKDLAKKTKGFYPAQPAALDVALYGLQHGITAGLEREARELGRTVVTPECKALVNLFFLTESAKGLGKSGASDVEQLNCVVIGAGVMGAGIAGALARSGCNVILKDVSEEGLQRGLAQIRSSLERSRSLSEQERSFILNRVELTTQDSPNLSNAQLVLEAVFEDMSLKKKILSDIIPKVSSNAIIASNTSSLSISALAECSDRPQAVVGLHFFNPVDKMPLLEIVRGKQTSDRTISVAAAVCNKLRKFPIVAEDVPGFLVNRILVPYLNEAAYLLSEGYRIVDIDKAATNFGMPMGPIRLLDEVGLDVAAHVSNTMLEGYGERMKSPEFSQLMVDAGRKGKKSKTGFYDYPKDKNSTNREIPFSNLRATLGIRVLEQTNVRLETLAERLILTMINEAVKCLDEGVAGAPGKDAADQVDLGSVMGFGFPPFRGGILYYADKLGAKKILEKLEPLAKQHGARFEIAPGIVARAASGRDFHSAMS